ncbi:hypothetical protein GCM10011585_32490 [Edaphobacter dinghuensis]|uniref:Uncharacterized protein n=1 Tax=Edaphobacter dinghuensis TaxID=1560005 RepID=A0A917M9I9_9BACT|nr:hypothetical protein GCM10011585_32490 [Edaphobacter dinghuensis]
MRRVKIAGTTIIASMAATTKALRRGDLDPDAEEECMRSTFCADQPLRARGVCGEKDTQLRLAKTSGACLH